MGGYATNPDTNATSEITGSGTANYMAKFTAAQVIGNSTVQDDGTTVTVGSRLVVTPQVSTSGAAVGLTFTGSANTGQTASAEINRLLFTTSSRQWATGAITTQREVYITSPTYSFVGASTITDAYTLYATAPTASTNATITNSWAAGFQGNIQIGTSSVSAYAYAHITSAGSNDQAVILQRSGSTGWAIGRKNTNAVLSISYASSGIPTLGTGEYFTMQNYGAVKFTPIATTANAAIGLEWTGSLNTNQTASTDVNGWLITTTGRQWATGAITTQREVYITSPTYSFVGASTITSAYTLYVEAPTAGTNATISSNYALGLSGNMAFVGGNASIIGSNAVTIQSSSGSNVILNAGSTTSAQITFAAQGTTRVVIGTGTNTSGAVSYITYSPPSNTGQTASTEINGFLYNSYTRTWAAGAITTQREQYIKTVTYAFASASTIAEAYAMYIEPPTVGSNATITNNFGLGISNGSYSIKMGQHTGTSTSAAVYFNQATPSTSNYTFLCDSSGILGINSAAANGPLDLRIAGNNVVRFDPWQVNFSPQVRATAAMVAFKITQAANTGQTASTEIPGFYFVGASRQWATGAITTQRETYFSSTTYTAVGASTITNAYGMYVEAPTASTNVTITNNWAIAAYGSLAILNNGILKLGNAATTGLVAGALAATTNASIVIYDSTGQAYRIPCII